MRLTETEQSFIDRRRRLTRAWPYVGSGMLVLIVSFLVWLVMARPLLANPFFVMAQLERGAIDQPTLVLMAGMLPVTIFVALGVCIATVVLAFAAFSNERRYLALHEKRGSPDESSRNPA